VFAAVAAEFLELKLPFHFATVFEGVIGNPFAVLAREANKVFLWHRD